jgi:hypothetical protein
MGDVETLNKKLIEELCDKMSNQDETYLDILSEDFTYHSAYETLKVKQQYMNNIVEN